jgi:hypothetical protein
MPRKSTALTDKLQPLPEPQPSEPPAFGLSFRLKLPTQLYSTLLFQAESRQQDIEDLCVERLERSATYTADIPIYFNDEQRRTLMLLLGCSTPSPGEVINKVKQLTNVSVAGVEIELSPDEIDRLRSRAIGISFEDYLKRVVLEGIRRETGLL